jgi:ABC-type Mn2+/Zn2+ transport system permease subunit
VSWLVEPFAYGFFTRAVIACVVIGAMCGAVSVLVVLRRMSYLGHGLAHSVLGGVAVGAALGWGIYPGAAVATLLSALLIRRVARERGLHADAAIGIVTTAMFALGIAVVSTTRSDRVNTEAILFGNVLGVTSADLWLAGGCAVVAGVALFRAYKQVAFVTFDPEVARVSGIRVAAVELAIDLATAVVVIVSIRVLGVLLIAAAVVIPAAVARLVTRTFGVMLAVSTAVGTSTGLIGLYASFHLDVPSGPSIVLVGAALFTVVLIGRSATARGRLRRARAGAEVTAAAGTAAAGAAPAGRVAERGSTP